MKQKKVSDLEDHLGYWLRYVSNYVSYAFSKRLEACGLKVAEWVVLRHLYNDPSLAPSVLAEKIGMTRGAVTKLVDRLIAKELIERQEASEDRRFQEVKLTKKGKDLVPHLAKLADENDEAFFGHLSLQQKRQLMASCQEIVKRYHLKQIPIN